MATSTAAARTAHASRRQPFGDEVAYAITLFFAALILAITVWLVYELWTHSTSSIDKFGLGFLSSKLWNPVTDEFGALPFIYGTVITSLLALIISVPLGVG